MLTGFVAFLDVLGFSALVSGEAHDQRIYEYLNALQATLNTLDAGPTVEYVVFSDSIVITTRDDSDASFISLMARCSVTFGTLLKHEIAVRGAIAHGTFVTSKTSSGTFVAGRAIIEAYKYETKQDWTGIMLAPSVVRKISNLSERCEFQDPSTLEVMQQLRGRLPYIACLQPCAVPFHNEEGDSSAYQGYAIVPTLGKYDFVSIRESVASSIEQLRRLMSIAPHPQAQQKHLRAINWLRALRPNWEMAEHRRVSQEQSLKRT